MKVTYLELKNVAGIYVGQKKYRIIIDFQSARHNICSIQGSNGSAKSVLLSTIHPFHNTTSLDERSTLPFFIPGKEGYKEIRYVDGDNIYIMKHYAKPLKKTHVVKSYFQMNGRELNENGNVTSFNLHVENILGIRSDMLRLFRLGSNVNSFISLKPAERKLYIGQIIDEAEIYLKYHKRVNDRIKVIKSLLSINTNSIKNLRITDIGKENDTLTDLMKSVSKSEEELKRLDLELDRIRQLQKQNDLDTVKREKYDIEKWLNEFQSLSTDVSSLPKDDRILVKIQKMHRDLMEDRIRYQSEINAHRMSIDTILKQISIIEASDRKDATDIDVDALVSLITDLKAVISNTPKIVQGFSSTLSAEDMISIVSDLESMNSIANLIYGFDKKPLNLYLRLKKEGKSVREFVNAKRKVLVNRISDNDLKGLLSTLFEDEFIITPNCLDGFHDCPYYRFSQLISDYRTKAIEEEVISEETLKYLVTISNNMDVIFNTCDGIRNRSIPNGLKDILHPTVILRRLSNDLPILDLTLMREHLTLIKSNDIYQKNVQKLSECEYNLKIYRKSNNNSNLAQREMLNDRIVDVKKKMSVSQSMLGGINERIEILDRRISTVSRYNDSIPLQKTMESNYQKIMKIISPLEQAENEKQMIQEKRYRQQMQCDSYRTRLKETETRIDEYNRLIAECDRLNSKFQKNILVLNSVSSKKGIPLKLINRHLRTIQNLANDLLDIIYGEDLKIYDFNLNEDTFDISFIRDGTIVPDVRYASQSELALMTMALSFALSYKMSGVYNILLLDEIDAGLDDRNRQAFLKMLSAQMRKISAEQVFMVSHNLNSMQNVPMDCIKLSDIEFSSKLQNVIYE